LIIIKINTGIPSDEIAFTRLQNVTRIRFAKLKDVTLEEDFSRDCRDLLFKRALLRGAPASKNRRGCSGELNKLITVIKYSRPVIKSSSRPPYKYRPCLTLFQPELNAA